MMFLRISLLLSLLCCWFLVLRATEHRVSNVAEINALLASLKPGDVVIMENKVWTNANIVFQATGTEAQPITLRADTPGLVFLEGTSNLRIAGRWIVVDGLKFQNGYSPSGDVVEFRNGSSNEASDCRLTNTAFIGYNPSNDSTDYKWVSIYGLRNRVDSCYFEGKTHKGATVVVWRPNTQANYHLIQWNSFINRPPSIGGNEGESIRIGTSQFSLSDSFTTVEYNYFEKCNGEIETISNKSCGNVYRYNTFRRCQGTLTLRHGNRCTVAGNFFFGEGVANTGGIRIIGEDHVVVNNYVLDTRGSGFRSALSIVNGKPNSDPNEYFQVKNAVVAFNTFVDNTNSFDIGTTGGNSALTDAPRDCRIANNLVRSYFNQLVRYTTTPLNIFYEGNIFFGSPLGITEPPGITTGVNPVIALASDGLWRPGAGSRLIGGAQGSYPTVVEDMDGQPRSDPKDIGADQFSTAPVSRRPLTRNDVGPLWMRTATSVTASDGSVPERIVLEQNFPNPFNAATMIGFTLREKSFVTLDVFNVVGQRVALLLNKEMGPGRHEVSWLADAPSGVYFYRLSAGAIGFDNGIFVQAKTMVLMK